MARLLTHRCGLRGIRAVVRAFAGYVATLALFVTFASAQEETLPSRVPETGLAILDCAPPEPAPEDSCLVRVPSDKTLVDVSSRDLGEEDADFRIVRVDRSLPEGVTISATLVLIDLSKGPSNRRLNTWKRERDQIRRIVDSLPEAGDLAIYGFGAELQRKADFSASRSSSLAAIDSLELTENNTILGSNVTDAISLLAAREDALLKNLIIISDGDEEGVGNVDAIGDAAAEAGVTLSAVGMFWRSEGDSATSRGLDVLGRMTRPQNGLIEPVFLRNASRADASVDSFITRYSRSIARSGVILPRGEAAEAEITVVMAVPVPGVANETREESYRVKFTPAASLVEQEKKPEETPEPPGPGESDEEFIFGYPALYVYIAAGVGGLLLILLLALLIRKGSTQEAPRSEPRNDLLSDIDSDFSEDNNDATEFEGRASPPVKPAVAPAPAPVVSAYLVRDDNGKRLPIHGDRIAIGRSSTNGIVMGDQGISRVHAELHRNRDGGYSVTDLESLNGTFVNEKKVTGTVPIRIGDSLGFGKVRAKLVLP